MNDKQQTAVEWLSEIDKVRAITIEDWKQAKEMEKQQIVNAYTSNSMIRTNSKAEQYYNETYRGNK